MNNELRNFMALQILTNIMSTKFIKHLFIYGVMNKNGLTDPERTML